MHISSPCVVVAPMPPLLRDLFDHSASGLPLDLTSVEDDEDLYDVVTRLQPDYLVVGLQDGWPEPSVMTAFAATPAVRVLGVSQRNGLVYVYSLDRGELGELDGPLLAKEMLSLPADATSPASAYEGPAQTEEGPWQR